MANAILQQVEALRDLTESQVIPHLQATVVFVNLADRDFEDWDKAMNDGTHGQFYRFLTPSYGRPQNQLGVAFSTLDSTQNQAFVAVDTPISDGFVLSDEQLATFPKKSIYGNFAKGKLIGLASKIDKVVRDQLQGTGFRWFANGNKTIPDETNTSFPLLTESLAEWDTFGEALSDVTNVVIPKRIAPKIIASMQNQFVPVRNDQIRKPGEIGMINGLQGFNFYSTNIIGKFNVGTVALKAPKAVISSIVNSTTPFNATSQFSSDATTIVLTGLTDGDIVKKGDLGDIGSAGGVADGQDALELIRPSDGDNTGIDGQFIVVDGGEVGAGGGNPAGEVSIQIFPRITATTGTNLDATVSRAVVTGASGDKVQFVSRNHYKAPIFYTKFVKFANPRLGTKSPFATYSHPLTERMKMTVRMYHGSQLEGSQTGTIMDCFVGCRTIPIGVGHILFAA